MTKTDLDVLELMALHCNDITSAVKIFGDDIKIFIANRVYQHAVIDCLLQIGELTTHLSEEFKADTSSEIDWIGLKVFRNISAHRYGSLKFDQTWNTMHIFLPKFVDFCNRYIQIGKAEFHEDTEEMDLEI